MTKEELEAKVAKQQSIINDANNEICSYVTLIPQHYSLTLFISA